MVRMKEVAMFVSKNKFTCFFMFFAMLTAIFWILLFLLIEIMIVKLFICIALVQKCILISFEFDDCII